MTTTITIPDDRLRELMPILDAKTPQEVIEKALDRCVEQHILRQRDLIPILGTFEDFMTFEEFEKMRDEE